MSYLNPISCVYKLTIRSYVYIGSTRNFAKRRNEHLWKLKNNTHQNHILQSIYNKHSEDNVIPEIIEKCAIDILVEKEQYWMDYYKENDEKKVINIDPYAGNSQGRIVSIETRAKKRASMLGKNKGKKRSAEDSARKSIRQKGRIITKEWRDKISATTKGIPSHRHQAKRFVLKNGKKYLFADFAELVGVKRWEMYQPYNYDKFQKKFDCVFIKQERT